MVVQLVAPMVQVWLSRSSICARILRHRESYGVGDMEGVGGWGCLWWGLMGGGVFLE